MILNIMFLSFGFGFLVFLVGYCFLSLCPFFFSLFFTAPGGVGGKGKKGGELELQVYKFL